MSYCLVYTTFADQQEAEKIAQRLVEGELAACVNIFPSITAIYRWKGKLEHGQEVAALIKSKDTHFAEIAEKIKAWHSYETCCVLKLPITDGSQQFLTWIDAQLKR